MVNPAREREVVERATPTREPSTNARTGRFKKLELNGSAGFSLGDDGPAADPPATDEIADPNLRDVTAAQFAFGHEVEHRSTSNPSLLV